MGKRVAGTILGASGAVTIFLSVFAAALLFVLALIPALIGAFQLWTGIRLMIRGAYPGRAPYIGAGLGILLGLIPLQANGPQLWPVALGLLLISGNGTAIWLLAQPNAVGHTRG